MAGLLDALNILRVALEGGRQPTEGDLERLREHSAVWRRQLEKLRSRLVGLTIEPPTEGPMRRQGVTRRLGLDDLGFDSQPLKRRGNDSDDVSTV